MMNLTMDFMLRVWRSMDAGVYLRMVFILIVATWRSQIEINLKASIKNSCQQNMSGIGHPMDELDQACYEFQTCLTCLRYDQCKNEVNFKQQRVDYIDFRKYFTNGIKLTMRTRSKFIAVICVKHVKIIFAHAKSRWQRNWSNWNHRSTLVSLPFMWVLI